MKKQLSLAIFFLLGVIGYSQSLDCSKLKNVKAVDPDYPKKIFVINGTKQESFDSGVLKMEWSVKWLTDCQYEVTCTKKIAESQIEVGDRIVNDIVSIDGDCFTLKRTLYCKNFPQGDVDSGSTFCIAK